MSSMDYCQAGPSGREPGRPPGSLGESGKADPGLEGTVEVLIMSRRKD